MDKRFDHKNKEQEIYKNWITNEIFHAGKSKEDFKKKPFVMIMPPPNLTGPLHLGHVLQHSLTDALIRYYRMKGYDALWLPGVDHAGIQMEGTLNKKLEKEEGTDKFKLGREKFLKYAWKWKNIWYKDQDKQERWIGDSADWDRKVFTLDPGPSKAVRHEFVNFYNEGLIYKGAYIVHWCSKCRTAITDIELQYELRKDKLYYVDYQFVSDTKIAGGAETKLTIATTRPETMLGDTALAVNPEDKRYKKLIGKKVILPLVGREIPVISDDYIDMKFGTGVLKVTPGHDLADYEIGKRHSLPIVQVVGKDGRMSKEAGKKYEGLPVEKARDKVVLELKKEGYLKKVEHFTHSVSVCERCKTVIEPIISEEWFARMKEIVKPAIKAICDGDIKFSPERYKEQSLKWLKNIRDWVVSRELWWGHRMPVWYCEECNPEHKFYSAKDKDRKGFIVSMEAPKKCPDCGGSKIVQEELLLDTWFSSGLWPMSTLGWPDEDAPDFKRYFPTDVMVTAPEILYLWICRMIFLALKFTGKVPFHTVFIHGMLRDEKGIKMSKSLDNAVDPLIMIEKYGADALRFTMQSMAVPGRDIRISKRKMEEMIKANRNFITKIWNIARYIQGLDNAKDGGNNLLEKFKITAKTQGLNDADKWILSEFAELHADVSKRMTREGRYDLAFSTRELYSFVWDKFADWYLEVAKTKRSQAKNRIIWLIFKEVLELLHPFVPFVTEEIWRELGFKGLLAGSKIEDFKIPDFSQNKFKDIKSLVKEIRERKNLYGIPSKTNPLLKVYPSKEGKALLSEWKSTIQKLAKVEVSISSSAKKLMASKDNSKIAGPFLTALGEISMLIPANINIKKIADAKEKEFERVKKFLNSINRKLSNKNFLKNAPEEIILQERKKLDEQKRKLNSLEAEIKELSFVK